MATNSTRPSPATTIAAFLLGLQAAFGFLSALVLLALSRRSHHVLAAPNLALRSAALGVLTLLVSAVLIVIATGVAGRQPWARTAAIVIETAVIAMNVVRLPFQPFGAAIGLALGSAIIALLFSGYDEEELPRGDAPASAGPGGGEPIASN